MSLPEPIPGLVISYSYLWLNESLKGNEEGLKNRPCAIVATKPQPDGALSSDRKVVYLIPITHRKPDIESEAVELPDATKKRLGLDDEPCWAICSEVNEFIWPGYDIRPLVKKKTKYDYGMLPPKLFQAIQAKIQFIARERKLRVVSRN